MGLFNQFPFTNFHEMNLDWMINKIKEVEDDIKKIDTTENTYTNVLSIGIINDGKTPVDNEIIKNEKYLYFPAGYYFISNTLDFSGKYILCENDTYFVGSAGIKLNNTEIEKGNYLLANGNFTITGGINKISNCFLSCKTRNSIDLAILKSEHTIIDKCTFDGAYETKFGIWNDTDIENCFFIVTNSIFRNYYLNAIYSSAENGYISSCYFYNNHLQVEPTGGGQIDTVKKTFTSHHTIIGCYFTQPGGRNTYSVETEGGNITVIGCYCNTKTGLYGIVGQNTSEIVAIGNVFDCDTDQSAIYSADNDANFYLVGNVYNGTDYPYRFNSKNSVVCDKLKTNFYKTTEQNYNFPFIINGPLINKTFKKNDLVRIFYQGSGFISVTIDGHESKYYYEHPSTLIKSFGEAINTGVIVQIYEYYIEIRNEGDADRKIIVKRE